MAILVVFLGSIITAMNPFLSVEVDFNFSVRML